MIYDAAIIGAGVTGAMTARALSKYDVSVVLIEKENDVAMGATKANSAICHAGFDAATGTLKAKLNVRGCEMMAGVCKELNVPYKNNGSLVLAFTDEEVETLGTLYDRGVANGVKGMRIVERDELLKMEPNLNPEVKAALLAETAGIVCPYELTIAAAECAASNGVEFLRNAEVVSVEYKDGRFFIGTSAGTVEAKLVINAAGVHAAEVARMMGDDSFEIIPRKGEYFVLDRNVGGLVSRIIFQCPTVMGKGILVTPTVDGNLLIGPTSLDVPDSEDISTTWEGLEDVKRLAAKSVPAASSRDAITSFSGVRAHGVSGDFVIGRSSACPGLINAACIESPGLSAAPAIAEAVEQIFLDACEVRPALKEKYDTGRPAPVRFRHLTDEQREELIARDPAYGRIVCRCETVTEGEIRDAITGPTGARDVDGVKRRTRAGMGRCQGGFCGSKVLEILAQELELPDNAITKFGRDSKIIYERTK